MISTKAGRRYRQIETGLAGTSIVVIDNAAAAGRDDVPLKAKNAGPVRPGPYV
jgi:hypothetical protein